MSRRQCLLRSALVLLGLATTIVGCYSSDTPGSPTTPNSDTLPPPIWHINGIISDNHGHKVTLSWAQLERGDTVTVPFHGNPSHWHLVTVSPEELSRIEDGERWSQPVHKAADTLTS